MFASDVATINRLRSAASPEGLKKSLFAMIANSSESDDREEMMQEPKDGYVRCGIIHLGAHLKFDVVNETPQVTVLTVVVDEGPLHIASAEHPPSPSNKSSSFS
jgi:hypothetical protein